MQSKNHGSNISQNRHGGTNDNHTKVSSSYHLQIVDAQIVENARKSFVSNPQNQQKKESIPDSVHGPCNDKKCAALIYRGAGTEEQGITTEKFPHDIIYNLLTLKLWKVLEIVSFRPRKITFDGFVSFFQKQKKGEQSNNSLTP